MRIKKYVAKSMREALMQIKEELGDDAVILKTSKLQKMFGPDEIEVTAALDEDAPASKAQAFAPLHVSGGSDAVVPAIPEPAFPAPPVVRPYTPPRVSSSDSNQYRQAGPSPTRSFPSTKKGLDEISEIKADVNELKDLVKTILTTAVTPPPTNIGAVRDNVAAPPAPVDTAQSGGITPITDSGCDAFVKRLTDSEVKPEIARKLVSSIRGGTQLTDAELEKKLEDVLSAQFPVSGPLKLKKGAPLTVAFVGPTGSGKTTTLAKLVARCVKTLASKKISIITADTYRIAAIEQIKTFADIMNVPVQIVFSPDDIPSAIAACDESDVVFVDTAGRSQRNREHMEELRILMDVLRPDETHLVLSATTKESDLLDMVHNYRNIRVNRLLFTKLDETVRLGNVFNVVSELGIPVSYFTVGQNVPDDIELAQAGKFVKRLMEGRAL